MSGSNAIAAARRRRAGNNNVSVQDQNKTNYSSIRQQQHQHQQQNYRPAPPGKIHIQQAFDILIQRVNSLEGEIQVLSNQKNDDYSSDITLLFEKLNTIERRFNTLIKDNDESLNIENIKEESGEVHNEFNNVE